MTKLNPTGTALVYSAYLGYGGASGIAIDTVTSGLPSAYISGWVSGADFPTTAGAYQTSYASGFAVKLSGDGTSEIYSTFLSGPSGYTGSAVDEYPTLAVPVGCASSCNAYITGRTTSADFPAINAIQATPNSNDYSAFIVELNSSGTSALFSSYLSGMSTEVYSTNSSQSFGITPAIAVDGSGNIYVAGNTTGYAVNSDFPITIPYPNEYSSAFLAKINTSASAGFTLTQPSSIAFGSQTVGVTSTIATVRLSNYSSAAVTGLMIQASPSVFAESDNCSGTIAAGGSCSLNVTFTPNAPSTRNGALTITSSAGNSPITVALSGTGYDSQYATPSVSSLTFASQTVGTTSAAQTFTLTNQGDETTSLNIYSNVAQFSTLNNCPPQLAPGASCTVTVTFSPTQPGLYQSSITIQTSNGPYFYVSLTGTGSVSGATAVVTPSTTSLQFSPQTANTTSGAEIVYITNTGSEPVVISSYAASGPFNITYEGCVAPYAINPQQTCQINVTFSPTTAGNLTGSITVTDNASNGPQVISLTGTGLASTQNVEFNPSTSISFPDTPQGTSSGVQTIYFENTGTAPITVDRTVISSGFTMTYSSCEGTIVNGVSTDGLGSAGYCQVNVEFTPSATASGSQTGTLTFTDSASGSPQMVNLMGNAITATGTIGVAPSALTFTAQPQGITSPVQYVYIQNPGNTPVTVTAATFTGSDPSDYSIMSSNCGAFPFVLTAGQFGCYVPVYFTPGGTGTRTATFTVASSAGNSTATFTGTGEAATQAIGLTPTSMNLGSIVVGQTGSSEYVYLRNTGTETVTFSSNPTITGTNAADFATANYCATSGSTLAAGSSCYILVNFSPSATGSRTATLTFADGAGTQSLALSGTGVTSTPTTSLQHYLFSFNTQVEGTTSSATYTYFYNNGTTSLTLGNMSISGSFIIPAGDDNCSGQTLGAGGSCYVYVAFAPTTAGYLTGTLTFKNSGGTALATVPLAGFSAAPVYSAYVNPTTNRFVELQVIGTTSGTDPTYLYNTGNTPFTVATVNGTNLGVAPSAEFSIASANGGYDGCSNQTVQPGSSCQVNITFTPSAAGTRSGTINFPVTYSNNSTATITGNITGTGVAERNSAVLTPPNGAFIDQVVGVTSVYNVTAYLNNSGNQPFTVSTLTNSNSAEFSTASSLGGYDGCSGATVQVGSSCQINVRFTPSTTGARSGSIGFPVTFADHTTTTVTLALTGKGVSSSKTIAITPASFVFGTEVQTVTSAYQGLTVTNTGNVPVTIGTDSISTNSAEFAIYSDNCKGTTLTSNQTCNVYVNFTPSSSATGTQTGVVTIADNATGGPHTVALSGIAITAAQQIVVSQSTLAFGNQPAGSTSSQQTFYITNQGDTNIANNGILLGGANAADFSISSNQCGGNFSPHASCYISVAFAPPTGTTGALTATIKESDSGTPGTHTITLTGTAVTPGPAATFNPASITFPTQNVGSTSAAQNFSVTNTGSANLNISTVVSTNPTEFPLYVDGCSGTTLPTGGRCTVSVQFSPTLGGARTGSIKVTDNASGSLQTLPLGGTGYGIPSTSYTPTSLTFPNTNINASSASQSVTLKNPGTDTLNISSISLTGGNANQFSETNTCPATLAPTASCVITVTFKPTAAGSQSASITVTDNANNIAGSTQSTPLSGTGVAVPGASVSPATLTFSSTNIGVTSAAQTATLSNSAGTGSLTITSIVVGGTDTGDYAQTNNCGSTLVAGSTCTISVTFKPTASGSRPAAITITDNASGVSGSTQTITLAGTGLGVPAAALSPTSLTFTNQNVSSTSAAQTITLSNSGTGPLTIASIALSGANAGDYATSNNCAGSVATAGSCTISVTFTPTAPGARTATLTVTDNAGNVANSTQTAALSGTGVGTPTAGVTPTGLTFASTIVGASAAAQVVTVKNSGTGPLTISSIVIGGSNPGDFTDTTTCGSSLPVSASCTISVTFTPTAVGSRTANLHVVDNSGNVGATQTVTLTGTGAASSPGTATYVSSDTTTEGTWTGKYGSDGGIIANSLNNLPAYATVSIAGDTAYTWAASSTDPRALQTASGATTRIASTYYTATSETFNVNITDGNTHKISLYLLDWDSSARAETITILNASTNAVLSTESYSSFHNGEYASWDISGNVIIKVTETAGGNAVISGLFFDPTTGPSVTATYVGSDTTTQGTWTGVYGSAGQIIAQDLNNPPAYATVTLAGDTPYSWASSTTDPRALQTASGASTRIPSTYYTTTSETFNVNITDGNTHKISLYLLDWDGSSRAETISILNAATNAVLSTESYSSFHNGEYAIWNVTGNVIIKVTTTAGGNAVVSGLFFD